MKACGGMYIQVHAFLTWALKGGVWSASQIVKIAPSVYSAGWVDPMDGLDTLVDGKNKNPDPNSLGFFINKRYRHAFLSLCCLISS